jgi:hypothetical protein
LIILGWFCGGRTVYRVFVGKPEGKRPLGRPKRRWVDNICMGLWVEGVYSVLVAKQEGKRPLWIPRRKCVDNIIMDLWEEGDV